jgi:dihydropyrimidinase
MYPKKGTLQPGSDADLVIWHSAATRRAVTIKNKKLHHGADYTPYEDMEILDWPKIVILRGKVAYNHHSNEVLCTPGIGEFVVRGRSTLP